MKSYKKISSFFGHIKLTRLTEINGFSMIEVLIAIVILSFGLLAVASMQVSALQGTSFSRGITESSEMIQDRIEKIMSSNYASIVDTWNDGAAGLNNATPATADYSDEVDIIHVRYNVYWNVATNWVGDPATGYAMTGVKTIRVIVAWQDRGRARTAAFDLLKTNI